MQKEKKIERRKYKQIEHSRSTVTFTPYCLQTLRITSDVPRLNCTPRMLNNSRYTFSTN